jgi:hypothetical protein
MALKSLEQANKEAMESFRTEAPNGIACPKCGEELNDIIIFGLQGNIGDNRYIGCSSCDYNGTRRLKREEIK